MAAVNTTAMTSTVPIVAVVGPVSAWEMMRIRATVSELNLPQSLQDSSLQLIVDTDINFMFKRKYFNLMNMVLFTRC